LFKKFLMLKTGCVKINLVIFIGEKIKL